MDLNLQLEMPLEALVLRHSPTAAGSLWAWLAVLAAAFGLWRIRSAAVSSKSDDHPRGHPGDQSQSQSQPPSPQPQPKAREASPPETRSPPDVAASDEGSYVSFARKGTVFKARGRYEEGEGDDRGGDAVEGGDHEQEEEQQRQPWAVDGGVVYGGRGVCWGERWRGDLGWYLHQDVVALNGRVVRLWEDEKRLAALRRVRRRHQVAC